LRLAHLKALAIAKIHPEAIIIGSDQVALLDNEQIGKPGNHEKALEQLIKMQGREVVFHTALCVYDGRQATSHSMTQSTNQNPIDPRLQLKSVLTKVKFRNLSATELDHYLKIEQPYDCAGSAKNEGLGIALMEYIQSDDPSALTGLPLIALTSMLRNCGIAFFQMR
jgi:septum formation protein